MSTYNADTEATHSIPGELEAKLVEAKEWYDGCPPAAITDDLARAQWGANGAVLLMDIVEVVERTWGFGAAPQAKP